MSDQEDRERRAREYVRRVVKGATRSLSKEGSRKFFRSHLESQGLELLLAIAREGDPDALEFLRDYARGARKATGTGMKMKVPDDFHAFVWDYFIDGPPKGRPGPKPQETLARNIIIKALVPVVSEEFRLNKTRDKSRHDTKDSPLSACAIVAQEMNLSEGNVEEICRPGARPT